MNNKPNRVLLLCYGNPGRKDDGLGAAFCSAIEGNLPVNVTAEADYQLTVEDAAQIADHDVVVFVDASVNGREPFFFQKVDPAPFASFSSHSIEPECLLTLANELFNADVESYALGIRGYEFHEFGETLSEKAFRNLQAAVDFFEPVLKDRSFAFNERFSNGKAV